MLRRGSKQSELCPAICPQCNGQLNVNPQNDELFCQYCGTKFLVEHAINQYIVQHTTVNTTNHIRFGKKGAAESFFEQIERTQAKDAEFFRKNWWKVLIGFAIFCLLMVILIKSGTKDYIYLQSSAEYLIGESYDEVMTTLKETGFINIKTKVINELPTNSKLENGDVARISIDGDSSFGSGEAHDFDDEVIVTYYVPDE